MACQSRLNHGLGYTLFGHPGKRVAPFESLAACRFYTGNPTLDRLAIVGAPKACRGFPLHRSINPLHGDFFSLSGRKHLIEPGDGGEEQVHMTHVEMAETPPNSIKERVRFFRHGIGDDAWPAMFEGANDVWLDRALTIRHKNRRHQFFPFPFHRKIGLGKKKEAMQFLRRQAAVLGPGAVEKPQSNVEDGRNGEGHGERVLFGPGRFPYDSGET